MTGTNFNNYPALAQVAGADGLLVLHKADQSASSAGTVHLASADSFVIAVTPSGDDTGVADAAAISAAVSALPATGGVVKLAPTATWYVECGQVTATTGQYIDAAGCYISAVGAGDVFRWVDSSTYGDRAVQGGGLLGFPIVDGANTTGNSCAVHAGDVFQLAVFVQAQNFTAGTTSKGVWMDNNYYWTEQGYGRIYAANCTDHVVFDCNPAEGVTTAGGSFDRTSFDIFVNQFASSQNGVVFQNGSYINDGRGLMIAGNFQTSSTTPTSAVLTLTGVAGGTRPDSGTYSSLLGCGLTIGVECGIVTGTAGPHTIAYGSASNSIYGTSGSVDFAAGGPNFQASVNVTPGVNFTHAGPVDGDDTLAGNYVGDLTTSQVTMYGGADNPFTLTGDDNGNPAITSPAGLYSNVQQSQPAASSVVTLASSNTLTSMGSLTVPAGDPVAGARYRVWAFGTLGTYTSAPTLTLGLYWGGTGGTAVMTMVTATNAAALPVSLSGVPVTIEGELWFTSTTACVGYLQATYRNSATATTAPIVMMTAVTSAVTVTTASPEAFALGAKWSASEAANTISLFTAFERVA